MAPPPLPATVSTLKTAVLATAATSASSKIAKPPSEKTAASSSLKTSLEHTHHLLNYAELPITAAAYSTRQSLLLVCDGRSLRVYSGTRCLRSAQLLRLRLAHRQRRGVTCQVVRQPDALPRP